MEIAYRPPQGTNKSALNLRWAEFLKSVPSRTVSPAGRANSGEENISEGTAKPTRQPDILILNLDEVSTLAQPRLIKEGNGFPGLGEANEFLPVDPDRVSENATSIDDSDSLVMAEKDLIYGHTE